MYESSDDSDAAEEKKSEHSLPPQTQSTRSVQKPGLNFFFNVDERVNTPKKKQRAESFSNFKADRVELTIWKKTKRRWKGVVEYAHLVRFCFSNVNKPPYILLMQLDGSRGRSEFAAFYDSIFARVCSEDKKTQATPQVFGVVLYFDEEVDYIRCQKTAGRISVTLGDVDRLAPGEFLNDNIIDFYLRFLWRHLEPWQQQEVYFFSSHFFTQLNGTNGAHELAAANPDERFARVARWTQKEMNLFDKRFLFIPINDSFHWSIAVFCNPGSAIIKKRRTMKHHPRNNGVAGVNSNGIQNGDVVDLVDCSREEGQGSGNVGSDDSIIEDVGMEEEELTACQEERLANPPCLLFLDSLRCHRKKKFTKMLRNYLECEWKARFSSSATPNQEVKEKKDVSVAEEETIITSFDSDSISLLEPNIPLQSNSSDCGVFLLMYAASIVGRFPMGVTRDDLESHLTLTLTPNMFGDEHVLEFREYLHQLLFCLQFLQNHGLPEIHVRDEGLDSFAID
ncbi:hypothetical protein BBO99_00006738 [Phytophthora kernoviae]|uniref:Ubiquitin-like protease family profile domain-containing protein n=2 Tax=Phytophthora kernoviae TaxID=325452 RepID=A0A3R7J591_9STRA|nr:hypothetical protein G195_007904 [Phytophthora kernoviae 00238/432]RLN05910.1 hypothetical protein BBI17_006760 [Phytophthora kernoviae]RLN77448.1 hypothetical protein BBO99_00006738 [Phytophthora kernoviae]